MLVHAVADRAGPGAVFVAGRRQETAAGQAAALHEPEPALDQRLQPLAGAGKGHRGRHHLQAVELHRAFQRGQLQGFLVAEQHLDIALGHARLGGQAAERQPFQPFDRRDARRMGQYPGARLFAPDAATIRFNHESVLACQHAILQFNIRSYVY
ncbi:hypothetical protein D9M68_883830 [compost metagenome]